jgi:hypothetical protein
MSGHEVATIMARESTRRRMTEAEDIATPSRRRSATAHAFQALAHRLDPLVAGPPRPQAQR